jgi:hypothetical protein
MNELPTLIEHAVAGIVSGAFAGGMAAGVLKMQFKYFRRDFYRHRHDDAGAVVVTVGESDV